MKTLEEKRSTRPEMPRTKEEFEKWLKWHADRENVYAWDFDFKFEINGHTVRASNLFGHMCVDNVIHDVRDYFCTIISNGEKFKPTDYIMKKIFG